MTVEARDDGLSGSGTDGRISVERQHTSDVRAGPAEGAWVTEWRRRDWSRERRRDRMGSAQSAQIPQPQRRS